MLLITAALHDELSVALSQHRDPRKARVEGVEFWLSAAGDKKTMFLKTGVGPRKSAASLQQALEVLDVSQILVIGYAGALDPRFKVGALVAVQKAMECSVDPDNPAVENIRLDGTYTLASPHAFAGTAESAHVPLFFADTLTSSHVWGHPEHKRILMKKFPAGIVDMETAALARVAQSFSLPIRCLRVISDEAEDSFLEPFAYDPQAGLKTKAGKILRSGNPVKLLRRWKSNTSIAKACMERFLREYFKTFPDQQSRLR